MRCLVPIHSESVHYFSKYICFSMCETGDTHSKRRPKKVIYIATICLIVLFLLVVIFVYVVIPIVFMLSFTVQEILMFTRFNLPRNKEYFNESFPDLKNFYIDVEDIDTNQTITLGVWHLLPWAIWQEFENSTTPIDYDGLLANSSYDVILHFHGTGESRRDSYNMFSVLRIFFHVIAFDYRSYGDSSDGKMTEEAVVADCKQLYKWLLKKTNAKIFVWGHSLGASLALHSMAELRQEDIIPQSVILEAAFTTMREEIPVHPYGQIFAWLPWLDATIRNPLEANGFHFNNTKHIVEIPCPIMAFHAEDDSVIPFQLGQTLNSIAVNGRNKTMGKVIFHQISAKYGCDHFWLYIYPDLPLDIENFLSTL